MNRPIRLLTFSLLLTPFLRAETCTTQSAIPAQERNALADQARTLAIAVQTNDVTTLRATSTADIQTNFGALQYLVAVTSPKLAATQPRVEQVYLLDASNLKPNPDGSAPDAQFFCSLNKSTNEADFVIPGLPPGKYAFVMVSIAGHPDPWLLSMLLRQEGNRWLLAGFYPKSLILAGHDGLWYWTQARQYAKNKQPWTAWLYYEEALKLLRPADFVLSTHLDKLHTETTAAAPPALSDGLSAQTPLVLKASAPAAARAASPAAPPSTFRFTGLSLTAPATGDSTPTLAIALTADPLADPAASRQRDVQAAQTLLAAYPELRSNFKTISVTTESPGQAPSTTQLTVAEIP